MLHQYPKKINNISFSPIYTNTLHFAEDTLDGIAEKNLVTRGTGLYITKNQIESMEGSIAVESTEEKGTTFKINF